jgi:hypothetical protein
MKKNRAFYCFVTSLWLLSLKNDINVPSKRKKHKNLREKKLFFVGIFKVTDEKKGSRAGFASGSVCPRYGFVPKCHGSETLAELYQQAKII